MYNLVPSTGEYNPPPPFANVCRRTYNGHETHEKTRKALSRASVWLVCSGLLQNHGSVEEDLNDHYFALFHVRGHFLQSSEYNGLQHYSFWVNHVMLL